MGEGASAENKFTNTFLWMVSADWTMQEVIDSHKYDLLAVQGFKWNSVNDDTWGELRKLNPDVKIFSYYQSRIKDDEDHKVNPYKSTMGRWNISRGHSLGNCNTDNPDMFLYNIHGDRVNGATIHNFVPDWSNPKFIKYWIEAWRTDNLGRPWQSDGVFIDEVQLLASDSGATTNPVGINWTPALINWINKVTKAMTEHDTLVWLNSGTVKDQKGIDAYVELDNNLENLVYFAASEGSYVVGWGSGDCQFFSEKVWLKQVEVSNQIHRINYGMQSFVRHKLGDNVGVDNWGKPVTVKDALWYGLCSYHLSKNTADNNTFFSFNAKIYSASEYYDEYDINLGNAVDTFKVTNIGGNNIYYREFEKGYVYVNPTTNNVNNIALPETCKQLTYTNFKNNPSTISDTNTINLVSHRGTFLLKSDGGDALDTTLPEVTLFTINPTTANTNQTIIASYAVTDNKELKQVELWRTTDSGGVPNASNWTKIKINSVSGTSASGSFTDSISTAGTYWYGLHVVDNANPGNIGYEPSSVKVVVNSVVLEIPPVPTIPSFPDIQSNGNTYHVDKDIGSNSNNGSSGSPWATIQYGVDQLSAGDTLIVHEGATAYAEEVDISVAGSSDNWITIQGKSGQAVEITHSSGIGVELTSAAKYIYIENFKVTTIGGGRGTRCNSGSAYIAYDNMEFDGTGNGIDGLILGINLTLPGVKYVYVRNVEIHHYNGYGTLLNKPGEKFYFYNCVAHHNGDDGFAGRSNRCASHHLTDIYFTDCYSHDNTGEGWDIGAKYGQNILKNCVSSNNNTFGFKIWGNSTWFVNCLSYGNENGDMNLKSLWTTPGYDVSNVYILNCTFHGQHASHSGNIIGQKENNSGASCGIEQMVDTELYLYNNIFWATNRTILFWHTNYSVAEADHNYFFAAGNIVSYQYRQNYSTVLKTYYISDMNNNVFFNAKGLEANSFARWTSEHGLSDPGFVNLVGDDYKLIGTSFAVDAGKNVGVNYDILGAQRPQGLGYDIGAYEYIQTDATSP
ncbi:hypothetical protein KAS41_01110 [Candidatus Parcubacteria bacterium]|nr:hypothetical protein [Candidatus Parcubacteria bacterium]